MTTIAVIGATGRVGTPTVQNLLSRGIKVKALTRSAENVEKLPPGAEGIVGDLDRPEGVSPLLRGAQGVFLITSNGETETRRGLAAVAAAKAAKVNRIVFLSVIHTPQAQIPHFESKRPIEEAIKASGIPYDFLRPNFFFQNDLLAKAALLKFGVYPHPIGLKGQNRIDAADISAAAVSCLTQSGKGSGDYTLQGPESITGEDAAAIFGKHLGREIRYGDDDLEKWEETSKAFMPPWLLHSLKVMYADMQKHGAVASVADIQATRDLAGRELTRFDPWAGAVCATWQADEKPQV